MDKEKRDYPEVFINNQSTYGRYISKLKEQIIIENRKDKIKKIIK